MAAVRQLSLLALTVALAAPAVAETSFSLAVQRDGKEAARGVGVLLAKDVLLTSAKLVAQGDKHLVLNPAAAAELTATVTASDAAADLALLSVRGLIGEPVPLALVETAASRKAHLLLPGGTRREGTLHSLVEGDDGKIRYRFTMAAEEAEAAAPLMNNCGELLAVSQEKGEGQAGRPDANLGVSGSLPTLKAFLQESGVNVQTAGSACESTQDLLSQAEAAGRELAAEKAVLEQALQRERKTVEAEKASVQQQIKELEQASPEEKKRSQERIKELKEQAAALDERLRGRGEEVAAKQEEIEAQAKIQEGLRVELERQREESELKEAELARQRQEQADMQSLQWAVGTGLVVLVVLGALLFGLQRRAARKKEQESNAWLPSTEDSAETAVAESNGVLGDLPQQSAPLEPSLPPPLTPAEPSFLQQATPVEPEPPQPPAPAEPDPPQPLAPVEFDLPQPLAPVEPTFSDSVLVGRGPSGQEIRLKINGNALAQAEDGQVIGRSSTKADYILPIESVSRKHARLRVDGETMAIEDLDSLNGTGVDGSALKPGEPRAIRYGGTVTIGEIEFSVSMLSDDDR